MKEKSKTNWLYYLVSFGLGYAANMVFPGLGIAAKAAFQSAFAPVGEGGAFEYEPDGDLNWVHFEDDEEAQFFEERGIAFEGYEQLEDGSFYAAIHESDMELAETVAADYVDTFYDFGDGAELADAPQGGARPPDGWERGAEYADHASALGSFGVDAWI